jgi:hypothetical protein
VSAIAWAPHADLDQEEWVSAGRRFGAISRCSQWWIGDWVRFGAKRWGEKYVQAARITGYDVASLRNMAWVSSQFDLSLRSDKLTWSHHALLAPLCLEEKQRWIERAGEARLSVADLRVELRAERAGLRGQVAEVGGPHVGEPSAEPAVVDAERVVCPNCGQEVPLAA